MGARLAATVLLLLPLLASASAAAEALTSPLVDRAIYREGAVRRTARVFAGWTVVCDEIAELRQRFCSLRSATAADARGAQVAIDVSTGDDGRPAALLHLPLGVLLRHGVRLAPAGASTARTPRAIRTVGIARCDARTCSAIADLRPQDLSALDRGEGLLVSYCVPSAALLPVVTGPAPRPCEAERQGTLSGTGFHDAVAAALHE